MDTKELKEILAKILSEYNFVTKNSISRLETDELIIVISIQKSNYSNSYYVNYGFLIKILNPKLINPKDNQCDVRGRLNFEINGKILGAIDLENTSRKELLGALKRSISERIEPVLEFGLLKYFEIFPAAILTVASNIKQHLDI